MKRLNQGITIIEKMVSIAVAGLFLTLAASAYRQHIHHTHRQDALATLLSLRDEQKKFYDQHAKYGELTEIWKGVNETPLSYYNVAITQLTDNSFALQATAKGAQQQDHEGKISCKEISLSFVNGTEQRSPEQCW